MKHYVNFSSDAASIAQRVEQNQIKLLLALPYIAGHTMTKVRVVSCVAATGWVWGSCVVSLRSYTPCSNATSLEGPPSLCQLYTTCSERSVDVNDPGIGDILVPIHYGTVGDSPTLVYHGVLRELDLTLWDGGTLVLDWLSLPFNDPSHLWIDFTLEVETF